MNKSTITIILATALLLGAAGLAWWNPTAPEAASELTGPTPKTARPSAQRASLKTPPKWASLTNHTLSTDVRLDLARSIDTDLNSTEIDLLLASFTHTPPHHSREQWWLVLNEIMEQMRKKGVASDRLGPALTALVRDPSQPEVVRDYAVQHLSQWIAPPTPDTPSETSPEAITAALQSIAATITDPSITHTSIPGTALMALTAVDLPEDTIIPVWRKLDPSLSAILKGETYGSLATKTTIIQSAALRDSEIHLPLIQVFARDEQMNPSMRLSSIAALGIYRSETDRDYLTSMATGSTRYRYAAQSALKKLSH